MDNPKESSKSALDRICDRAVGCLQEIAGFLTPPSDEHRRNDFARRIATEIIRCEAVSIFMSDDDPNRLDPIASFGYTGNYAQTKYYATGVENFLTSYVYRRRMPINMSAQRLLEGRDGIPFSGRCRLFIESQKFLNLIAVPILVHEDRCVGVLKMENKEETTDQQTFPDEDFAFARVLASHIGVAYQQRLYGQVLGGGRLWDVHDHSRNIWPYLQSCSEFLAHYIRTECVSIFVRERSTDGKVLLRYRAGVGYRREYQKHAYDWMDSNAFTIFVAHQGVPIARSEKKLMDGQEPYTGACVSYIESGEFRNILAIPLMHDHACMGVLKLENKLPSGENFDDSDSKVCFEFARERIVSDLLRAGATRRPKESTKGFQILVKNLGTPPPDKETRLSRASQVIALQEQNRSITGHDCADYLCVSRPHYYRLRKTLRE